jgi:rhodanese-related sulfurtransferase
MITIHAAELHAMLQARPATTLLNVRPRDTPSDELLPGSQHVPLAGLKERVEALAPDKGADVVVYGADLTCEASTQAADILEGLGYTHVYNFMGGLKSWKDAGFALHEWAG